MVKGGSPMWNSRAICVCGQQRASSSRCWSGEGAAGVPPPPRGYGSSSPTRPNARRVAKLATERGKPGAINSHYLCAELSKRISAEDVVFSEAARNGPAVTQQIHRCQARWCASAAGLPRAAWRSACAR